MDLIQQIDSSLVTAMKEGIASRTAVLRLLKNAIKNEQIRTRADLAEADVIKVLQREAKQRRDSIEAYQKASRPELAADEAAELKIIEEFLPEKMPEEELIKIVDRVIADTGASGMSQMGVVIGEVMKQTQGAASGAAVAQIVRERLSAK